MGKIPKNPSYLTNEDIITVDHVFAACTIAMYHILELYTTPQAYVQEFVLDMIRSDKKSGFFKVYGNLLNQNSEKAFTPGRLNRDLAKESRHFFSQDDDAVALNRFLHPSDMSEVVKKLETDGIFENIRGKKIIKSQLGIGSKGRPQKNYEPRTGGRPSMYKITENFETIKRVMAKQEACELRKKLLLIPLTYKFELFNLLALIHLLSTDMVSLEKLLWLTPRELLGSTTEMRQFLASTKQYIISLNNKQIVKLAKTLAETRRFDVNFVFGMALF